MFRLDLSDRLTALLGDEAERAAAVAALRATPAMSLGPRIRELVALVLEH
jgi:hypothetical protein